MHLNSIKTGLTFGLVLGGVHLLWSILVALGWAQWLVNFSMWAHMIHVDYTVGPFDAMAALTVIVVAFCVGFILGKVFALVWNKVHKS